MNQAYIRFPQFKNKALTLSYDDGVRQDKRLIEIMKRHGLKGTFNINSGMFEKEWDGVSTRGRMTEKEALDLYIPAGMEVAAHGHKHLSLSQVHDEIAVNDVLTDRKELERLFGRIITGMAYANGAFDDSSVDILKRCGISYCRTVESTGNFNLPADWLRLPATCHHDDPRLMELAKEFLTDPKTDYWWAKRPRLFYLWGHGYEFDVNDNWYVIEEFAEFVGGRDDVWYATNGEIFNYLQACNSIKFSIDGTLAYNPACTDVYLDMFGKRIIVPAGKTVVIN